MTSLGMFDTAAVILDSGKGWSDVAPLCAIDMAMHPQQQANYHAVTSLVPSDAEVYRLKPGAEMILLDGAHVPAVMRWETSQGRDAAVISAGIGIGLPGGGQTGVIYHDAGAYGPDDCKTALSQMVTEGMAQVRGVSEWDFHTEVRSETPDAGHPNRWYAVFASLTFLDADLLAFYDRLGVLIPV